MVMHKALQDLLDRLPQDQQLELPALFDAVYQVRFTGPLTFDFLNGIPHQINLGQPVKLSICAGTPSGGLDDRKPRVKG